MFLGFYHLILGFRVGRQATPILLRVTTWTFLGFYHLTLGFRAVDVQQPQLLRITTWMFLGFYHLTLGFRVGRPAMPFVAQDHLDVFRVLLLEPGFWG
jgi:hypothetical protein